MNSDDVKYLNFEYTNEALGPLYHDDAHTWVRYKNYFYRLGLSLSRSCNFKCGHCYYHGGQSYHQPVEMSLSLLKTILHSLPQMASINLGMEGEPFTYPHLFEALSLIATKTDSIMLVSNGSLLTSEKINELRQYPITNMVLSLEGATQNSYEKWRRGGSFPVFKRNATLIANKLGHRTSLHATVFKNNLPDLLQLPQLAYELGIMNLSFQLLRSNQYISKIGIQQATEKELLKFLQDIIEISSEKNIMLNFDAYFASIKIMSFLKYHAGVNKQINIIPSQSQGCTTIFQCTSILADGRLFPCCGDFRPSTIETYSFDGIFNHSYLRKLRYLTQRGWPPYPCKICHHMTHSA